MNKHNVFILFFLSLITTVFFIHSNILYYSVMSSFNLFYDKVYLVLFPFLILGNILISYNVPYLFGKVFGNIFSKIFKINSYSSFLIFLSMITGFPTGSVYINKFFEEGFINSDEAIKLLSISFFPSPMFVISTVGVFLLKNIKLGIIILLSLYITNFLLGLIIRNKYKIEIKDNDIFNDIKPFGVILKESILTSFNTLLLILGNITIFMIISNLIFNYLSLNSFGNSLISGILEMTNGVKKISDLYISNILKVIYITFILSFSGFSIHSQVLSILNKNSIYKEVFINRIFASFLSVFISFFIYLIGII